MKELLKLNDVTKFYNTSGNVALGLRHVNATFMKGEFVAITGESGSGKSTLLSVLSGLDTYEEGEMYINGEESSYFSELEREVYRKEYISFVFQDYNIIDSYTVYQNVELALFDRYRDPAERKKVVWEILEKVGLTSHAKHRGTKLSGGQKQRVSIARALAKDAPILFADEPTGNLDSKTSEEIIRLMDELSRDKLVILVTHNYDDVAKYATRRLRLFDGEVAEDKNFVGEEGLSEEVRTRIIDNGLDTPLDGYAVTDKETIAAIVEYDESVAANADEEKKARRAKIRADRLYYLRTTFTIALNNLRAAPKLTFFLLTGFVLLGLAVILTTDSAVDAYKSGEAAGGIVVLENDRRVYVYKPTEITDADEEEIKSISGVACVAKLQCGTYGINFRTDLSDYLSYEGSEYYDYILTDSYVNILCNETLSYNLQEGRQPENANEVVICIDEGETKNELIGSQIDIYPYSGWSSDFDLSVVPTMTKTVVGYFYPDDSVYSYDTAILMMHDEYEEVAISIVQATGNDPTALYTNNRTLMLSSADSYRSVAAELRDKGYRVYYPYGLNAQGTTIEYLVYVGILIALLVMVSLVMLIIGNTIKKTAIVKKRDYSIMKSVGISTNMLGNMFYTETGLTAILGYIIGSIVLFIVRLGIVMVSKVQTGYYSLSSVKDLNFITAFVWGIPIIVFFWILVLRKFKKKLRATSIKAALVE